MQLQEAVLKVQKIVQWNDCRRFDLYVEPERAEQVLQCLRKHSRRVQWYIRDHIPDPRERPNGLARRRPGYKRLKESMKESLSLGLMSWNICGCAQKRTDLEYMLHRMNIDIFAIQETLRSQGSWSFRVTGYQCLSRASRAGTAGARGVALGVASRSMSMSEIGAPHDNWVLANVTGASLKSSVAVGSVYIPGLRARCRTAAWRRGLLTTLAAECRRMISGRPDRAVWLMGDWNMSVDLLQRWIGRSQLPMAVVPVSRSPLTYRGGKGGRRRSAIDHVVAYIPQGTHWSPRVQVKRQWDMSDHWPLKLQVRVPSTPCQQVADGWMLPRNPLRGRVCADRLKGEGPDIASHNLWDVLLSDLSDDADNAADAGSSTGGDTDNGHRLLVLSEDDSFDFEGCNQLRDGGAGGGDHGQLGVCSDSDASCDSDGSGASVADADSTGLVLENVGVDSGDDSGSSCSDVGDVGVVTSDDSVDVGCVDGVDGHEHDGDSVGSESSIDVNALVGEILAEPDSDEDSSDVSRPDGGHSDADDVEASVDSLERNFLSTAGGVLEDLKLLKPGAQRHGARGWQRGRRRRRPFISRAAVAAIEKRRAAFRALQLAGRQSSAAAEARYRQCRRKSILVCKRARQRAWHRSIREMVAQLRGVSSAIAWRWIKTLLSRRPRSVSAASSPIRDPVSGEIVTEPEEVSRVWLEYFRQLSAEGDSHSKDIAFWQGVDVVSHEDPLPDLNGPLEWTEVCIVLEDIHSGKAAGPDCIPGDLIKLARDVPDDVGMYPPQPSTPMGRALLLLLQRVWQTLRIPEAWRVAAVVPLFKKGDRLDMDNYRGISLISVVMKVLCSVVIRRVQGALEGSQRLRREQAGFRPKEECVAQATALYEILKRRKDAGDSTYVVFIDLQKAYDSVPHEALLRKLHAMGVRGRAYEFIARVYESSNLSMAMDKGANRCVPLQRGVRQGCPMSPLLFNVFINDILDGGLEDCGVMVPGVGAMRVPGLLFADDLVLLSPTLTRCKHGVALVQQWCVKWKAKIGVAKCGVMVVGRRFDKWRDLRVVLPGRGDLLPVVESYEYLGLLFHHSLEWNRMVDHRVTKAVKALHAARPFLSTLSIPVSSRLAVLKCMVLPVALYGAELWGMRGVSAQKLQVRVLNVAVRWIFGMTARSSALSVAAALDELDLCCMHAVAASRRARGFVKYQSLNSWIATLMDRPVTQRPWTWVTGCRKWIGRYVSNDLRQRLDAAAAGHGQPVPALVARQEVLEAVQERWVSRDSSKGGKRYRTCEFGKTRQWWRLWHTVPSLQQGMRLLMRCRVSALWTVRRFARIGWLSDQWLSMCPFCEDMDLEGSPVVCERGEDMTHLLVV